MKLYECLMKLGRGIFYLRGIKFEIATDTSFKIEEKFNQERL